MLPLIIGGIVVLFVIAGAIFFLMRKPSSTTDETKKTKPTSGTSGPPPPPTPPVPSTSTDVQYLKFENKTSDLDNNTLYYNYVQYRDATIDQCKAECNKIGSRCAGFTMNKPDKICALKVGNVGTPSDSITIIDDSGSKTTLKDIKPQLNITNATRTDVDNEEGCSNICTGDKSKCDGYYYREYYGNKEGAMTSNRMNASANTKLTKVCMPLFFKNDVNYDFYVKKT